MPKDLNKNNGRTKPITKPITKNKLTINRQEVLRLTEEMLKLCAYVKDGGSCLDYVVQKWDEYQQQKNLQQQKKSPKDKILARCEQKKKLPKQKQKQQQNQDSDQEDWVTVTNQNDTGVQKLGDQQSDNEN